MPAPLPPPSFSPPPPPSDLVRGFASEFVQGYQPPKVIRARLNKREPESDDTLFFDLEKGTYEFRPQSCSQSDAILILSSIC
jgi:hypothetical protein